MKEIEIAFKRYLKAIMTKDYETMYSSFLESDMQRFRDEMVEIAVKIDAFGESQDFVNRLGFNTLSEVIKLSLQDFMFAIFNLIAREVGEEELNKMIAETYIKDIEQNEHGSKVPYQYPIKKFGEWEVTKGDVQMNNISGEWKLYFKSGLESKLSKFHEDIDRYFERKSKDNIANIRFEGDLTKFSIIGFKDFSSGKVVFEPRFRDAGDFSEGLAYVQIMKKYGYINLKGDIEIKPEFLDAKDFSQNLAAVKIETPENKTLWGFINKKGKLKIPPSYEDARCFKQGLCAVKIDGKWGYINNKAELIIQCKFDAAEDFSSESAYADIINENNETIEYIVYKNGKMEEI